MQRPHTARQAALPLLALALLSLPAEAPAQDRQQPPFRLPDNVEMKKEVVYGKGGGRDLKLDLFLPRENAGTPRPGIVFVHGGAWQGGNRGAFARQAAYLAGKGYVGACIEYRLSGEATFPAAIEDCKAAVRWLRANAKTYHLDPDRIAACGGSAGGHLVALLGVSDKVKELEGVGGNAGISSRVNLVIAFNGVFDLTKVARNAQAAGPVARFLGGTAADKPEVYRQASPITHLTSDAPPFLFLHGTADKTVPIEQSRAMLAKLRQAGVKAELYEAEGAGHGFFNRPPHYEPTLKRMEAFLDEHFRPKGTGRR
jgi:acetyl esterase/lipase